MEIRITLHTSLATFVIARCTDDVVIQSILTSTLDCHVVPFTGLLAMTRRYYIVTLYITLFFLFRPPLPTLLRLLKFSQTADRQNNRRLPLDTQTRLVPALILPGLPPPTPGHEPRKFPVITHLLVRYYGQYTNMLRRLFFFFAKR